ncbi:MAG: ABC transporter ATP-binding protein/permease [Lachnospiraceae bacterium]|nr:ABC transporter ATP-binding protein/permease [Lachnospiraceae bacterium]
MNKIDDRKDRLSVSEIVKNALFMIRYAAGFDRKLVMIIIGLFCISNICFALYDTLIIKFIIEKLQDDSPFKAFLPILAIGFVLTLIGEFGDRLKENWVEAKLVTLCGSVQRTLVEKNGKLDLICYDDPKFYDLYITTASNADDMVKKSVLVTAKLISGIIAMITATAVLMTVSPIIAIFPLAGFIVNLLTRYKIEEIHYLWDLSYRRSIRQADYAKRVFYQPEYAKECKMTDVRNPLRKHFDEALEHASDAGRQYGPKLTWVSLINWICVFTIFSFFCVPATLGYLALVVKSIALGEVAATNNAANYIRRNLDRVNFCLVDLQQIGQYASRFRKILSYETNIESSTGSTADPDEGDCTIRLEHVSFRYPHSEKDTLQDISMTIRPGEKIAIVGENGAGKTTFVKLLMRLYDVSSGQIIYSKHDIRDYAIRDYRREIGAVFQDYQIYAATLGENVMMHKTGPDDEQTIIKALNRADFGKRLATLENGTETELTREFSEEGVNLSGGESQKIAIARIFAGDHKKIFILDEPSSALDPVSEYKLNQNLIANAKDATVIFISHRLSTTRMADRIFLFDHGRIKEQGSHEELMTLGGDYKEMFDRQARSYIS